MHTSFFPQLLKFKIFFFVSYVVNFLLNLFRVHNFQVACLIRFILRKSHYKFDYICHVAIKKLFNRVMDSLHIQILEMCCNLDGTNIINK